MQVFPPVHVYMCVYIQKSIKQPNRHTHTHACVHIHTYIHTYTFSTRTREAQAHTYIQTYILVTRSRQVKRGLNIHTCMHAYIHTYIHTDTHTYIRTYVHTYMCVCTYVCAHTHTDTRHTCLLRTHLVIICIFAVARTMSGVGLDVSDVEASFIAEFWCFSLRGRRGQFQLGGGMQIESTSAKVFRPPKLKDGMPSRTHMKSQGAQKRRKSTPYASHCGKKMIGRMNV